MWVDYACVKCGNVTQKQSNPYFVRGSLDVLCLRCEVKTRHYAQMDPPADDEHVLRPEETGESDE